MRGKRTQVKSQKSLLFCKLCSYVATSESELEFHYRMSHDPDPDISEEFEAIFANRKSKENKPKTLKEKAIEQLKLLAFGKIKHHEYYGSCEVPYFIVTKKEGNITKIKLEQGMWIC